MLIAGFQLIPIILNIISSDWLEVVLFFTIFLLSVNLSIKSWQVYRLAEDIEYKSQWISTEDRLPESANALRLSSPVFIYSKLFGRQIAIYDLMAKEWIAEGKVVRHKVTHWMPFPKNPKK